MPLANYDDYVSRLSQNRAVDFQAGSSGNPSSRLGLLSRNFILPGTIPTTSIALDRTSDHSLGFVPAAGSGQLTVLGARIHPTANGAAIAAILVDLLNISGGMDGTATTPQSTNLPGGSTAALTRYTNGEGVMAGLVFWSSVGAITVTATVNYTNTAGTSGCTTTLPFGTTGAPTRIIPIPLAAGDTGVRSVQSVTLSASTGAAGNFGLCLFKPLSIFTVNDAAGSHIFDAVTTGGFIGALNAIQPNACLSLMGICNIQTACTGAIIVGEI